MAARITWTLSCLAKPNMKTENPYGAPITQASSGATSAISVEKAQFARFALLGLRLLGVMFIVDGISSLSGSGATIAVQYSQSYSPRSLDMEYYDAYNVGAIVASMLYVVAGIYLLLSPRWLLKMFFLPATPSREQDPAEVDDEAD